MLTETDKEKCRTCDEEYDIYGDGYDGECPSCADVSDDEYYEDNYEDEE